MAFRNIAVTLSANVSSYRAQMAAAAASTREVGREAVAVASRTDAQSRKTLDTLGRLAAVTSVALAAGFTLAGREAMAFERDLRNVNSISGMTEEQLSRTGDALLEMATDPRIGQMPKTLSAGLYDIASSGFQGAEGLTVLKSSAQAASAGLTTAETSARAITAVLNAYGLQAADSAHVSDVLFQAVNKGVVTFEELAASVGDWVGAAAAAGVPVEDASAALATMTLAGISAAEAGTSLNQVFRQLIDPSDELKKVFQEAGFQSGQMAIDTLGLKGVMDLLRESTGGQIEQLIKLFPEIRGARGALALMAAEGRNYNDVSDAFTDKTKLAGVTARVLEEQSKSLAFQLDVAKASVSALAIDIGDGLIPIVRPAVEFVSSLASGFRDLPDPVQSSAVALAGVVTVTAGLGGAFLLLAPKIKAAVDMYSSLATTAPRLAAALKLSGVALGGVGIALAAGAAVLAMYAREKEKARQETELFVQWLQQERDGVEDATRAGIAEELQKRKLLDVIDDVGASRADVVDGILGEQKAIQSLGRELLGNLPTQARTLENQKLLIEALNGSDEAYRKLQRQFLDSKYATDQNLKSTLGLVKQVGDLSDAHSAAVTSQRDLVAAQRDAGVGADDTRAKLAMLGDEAQVAAEKTEKLTDAQKLLGDALESFIDPTGIYGELFDEQEREQREAFERGQEERRRQEDIALAETERSIARRQELERRALDDELTAERNSLDSRKGLTDEQRRAERAAYEARSTDAKRSLDDKQAAEKAAFDAQEEQTKRGREDWDEFQGSVKISLDQYAAALEEQIANQVNWQNNLVIVAARAGTGVALQLAKMGDEGVDLVAAMATGTEAEVKRMAAALTEEARLGSGGARGEIEKAMLIMETLAAQGGTKVVEGLRASLAAGKTTVADVVRDYGYILEDGVTTMVAQIDRLNQAFGQLGSNLTALPNGQVVTGDGTVVVQLSPDGSFAEGGIVNRRTSHATVLRSPTIVAGEGRGSESYIPHHPAYRSTAVPVLHQTASALGFRAIPMETGGWVGPGLSPLSGGTIDYDRLASSLAKHQGMTYAPTFEVHAPDSPSEATLEGVARRSEWRLSLTARNP